MRAQHNGGFILALSVLLVVILSIGGLGFMQLDYLERRMATNNVDNHGGFYLANAGIERARDVLKIGSINDHPTWTPVLNGSDGIDDDRYPTDPSPDPVLCPDTSRGCVIPPFQTTTYNPGVIAANGDPVTAPDFPIAGAFDNMPDGLSFYSARAYNDAADTGTTDTNGLMIIRALGVVRGERKVLEITAQSSTGLKLVNCEGDAGDPCPETIKGGSPTFSNMDGRDPSSTPELPSVEPIADPADPTRCNPASIYCDRTKIPEFGLTITVPLSGSDVTLKSLTNNALYIINGNVTLDVSGSYHNVVVVSLGELKNKGNATLTDSALIAKSRISLKGNITMRALLPYPALMSTGATGKVCEADAGAIDADNSVTVYGTIFATGSIQFLPIQIHGVIIGCDVQLQGSSTTVTDDGNPAYYTPMPGVDYPAALKETVATTGSWREIQ